MFLFRYNTSHNLVSNMLFIRVEFLDTIKKKYKLTVVLVAL